MSETLKSILATDAAFTGFSIAALVATLVVAIGLFLEYERHELFGASKKQIGALMVAGGVVLEALFGAAAFSSASIRESRSEMEMARLTKSRNAIEEYLTPRWFMSQREYDTIGATLKPFAPQTIDLYWYPSDLEANRFEILLHDILKSSGWNVGEVPVQHPEDGSMVWYDPQGTSTTKAAHALVDVLNSQLRLSLGSPAGPLMESVGEYKTGLVMQQPLHDGKIALVIGTLAMAREVPDWVNLEGNHK